MKENNNQLKIGELPEVSIVPAGEILFHEEPDPQRVAVLVRRFKRDGVLKNPPIVAKAKNESRLILLDGANRVTALTRLALRDVLVQQIGLDDPGLKILQWHHAIEHLSREELISRAEKIEGLTISQTGPGSSGDNFLCRITFADRTGVTLLPEGDIFTRAGLLKQFTDLYHKQSLMDRVSYTNMDHLRKNYQNFTALVIFKTFSKRDIIALAGANMRLASGVTRVQLPKRALNFNLDLEMLNSNKSLEEKNRWLEENIRKRILQKSIRFYHEPTFFFDE